MGLHMLKSSKYSKLKWCETCASPSPTRTGVGRSLQPAGGLQKLQSSVEVWGSSCNVWNSFIQDAGHLAHIRVPVSGAGCAAAHGCGGPALPETTPYPIGPGKDANSNVYLPLNGSPICTIVMIQVGKS